MLPQPPSGPVSGRRSAPADVRLPVNVPKFMRAISVAAVSIIALGVFRELYVGNYGLDTVLRDLGQIALDSEGTLAAWFSSALMLSCCAVMLAIFGLERHGGGASRMHWLALALLFLAMSVDESVAFHEATIAPLRGAFDLTGVFYFSWVLIATPAMLILLAYFVPFLRRLPQRYAVLFAASGLIYVTGALGMEFAGGHLVTAHGQSSVQYKLAFIIEESLELIGLVLFLASLCGFLFEKLGGSDLKLMIEGNARQSAAG